VSHSDAAAALVYLRSSFHVPHEIRGTVSVGDLDSRHLSWSDFS
jgi:cob(II)yrinic acid a,c-diamide reductase